MFKYFIRDAFDEMAMGNYPWPSNYIAGSILKPMPAYPMKEACSHLMSDPSTTQIHSLYANVAKAVNTLYNVTGETSCNKLPTYPTSVTPAEPMDGIWDCQWCTEMISNPNPNPNPNCTGIWDFQWCTEMMPDSYWFTTTGDRDMFWDNPYNQSLVDLHCKLAWGKEVLETCDTR